ncbi:MAG: family penicillin-binding protein [Candidatus Saccharibacteria bacterium]|nr:family penicillin-binding protein [Candidatus Saccharibacteria bacterium]
MYPTQEPPESLQPTTETPLQHVSAPPKKTRRYILVLAAILVVIAGLALYLLLSHKQSVKPLVTLYYSDGKTVLWRNENPAVEPGTNIPNAPYFVDLVRTELRAKYGDHYYEQGAWAVTTTLDAKLQATAEKLIADNLPSITSRTHGTADEEALLLQDVQSGQIKALVGGVDYKDKDHGQINYAVTLLAPGSSIKPLDYAALIENTTNTGAGTALSDNQEVLPGYPCTNKSLPQAGGNCLLDYDFKYPGTMPLRYALGGSRNVPAVRAMLNSDPKDTSPDRFDSINGFTKLVGRMGAEKGFNCYADEALTQTTQCYGASALGDGAFITLADELHVLATLANNGSKVPQTTIYNVRLNGQAKANWRQPAGQQIIRPDTAYTLNDIMSDPNASYLPGSCDAANCASGANDYKFHRYNNWKFAVDPGVTNDGYTGNMAGWSSRYAVISWVGNHARSKPLNASVETLTKPLTQGLMQAAHLGQTPENWKQPTSIKTLPAYVLTNHVGLGDIEPSPATDIYPGWYKP